MGRDEFLERVQNASMPPGSSCCGKPQGCSMTHKGCVYLRHPSKRARLYGDICCWHCGEDVERKGDLCTACKETWACPCGTAVSVIQVSCWNCGALRVVEA